MFDKLKLLKNYLGPFIARPSMDLREKLRGLDVSGRILVQATKMNEVITFLMVKDGRKNYRVFTSTQIIDIYLGKAEESSFRDIVDPVAIILVMKREMENKRRWELVYQVALERIATGRGLIVIADDIPDGSVKDFKELGFEFVRGCGRTVVNVPPPMEMF